MCVQVCDWSDGKSGRKSVRRPSKGSIVRPSSTLWLQDSKLIGFVEKLSWGYALSVCAYLLFRDVSTWMFSHKHKYYILMAMILMVTNGWLRQSQWGEYCLPVKDVCTPFSLYGKLTSENGPWKWARSEVRQYCSPRTCSKAHFTKWPMYEMEEASDIATVLVFLSKFLSQFLCSYQNIGYQWYCQCSYDV